ncbi:MAG: Molybdate transporter, ATP-binding protein, partial [Myxococcales bacterium]|nr:Molybdate transporter, ATP-binding protein [Myxococcales bacterium]
SPLAAREAAQLSGGEARRVALARALVTEPEALLLDEPFNGVDDPARELLVADILASVRLAQRTLVLVTQRRDEALRLAKRLAILWNGELRQSGPIEDVLARPVDPGVARFLGLENVLKGRVTANTADGVVLDVHGVTLHASVARPGPLGGELWIVFSPEQVELRALHDVSRGSARNLLPAQVVALVPREGRVEIHLDAGFPLVAAVTRAAIDELGLAPGVGVRAVLKATALHLVPA